MKLFSSIKINLNKNRGLLLFFKGLPKKLAKKPLYPILTIFLFSLIWGVWLFYKYVILIEKTEPQVQENLLQIEDKAYQRILSEWQGREKKFREADLKSHLNPFSQSVD